jgi:hypothetical protein
MVKKLVLSLALLLGACTRLPGYGDTVSIDENGSVWDVKLVKSFHNDNVVFVQLEYVNRAGDTFSIKPDNLVITDDAGGRWIADGRNALLPLVTPGQTQTLKASFANVSVSDSQRLYVAPMAQLVHKQVKFLLKDKGATPLPGNHEDAHWDKAQ